MGDIKALLELDFSIVFIVIFTLLFGAVAIITAVEKISIAIKKPVKWVIDKRADHEMILENKKAIEELSKRHDDDTKQSLNHETIIRDDLKKLTIMFIDKQIDDMRWEILDFTSALSSGRKYNRESFDHIFRIYKKYEDILEENKMENGLVEESIKYVREQYGELLKDGKIK